VNIMNPQTPHVPVPSTAEPYTPVPAGYLDYTHDGGNADKETYSNNSWLTGPLTHTPLPAQPQAEASQFPSHPQGLPRVTKQLSPSMLFESNYPGNAVAPQQSPSNAAEEQGQQPYFEPGVAIGRQHFWSAEPVEWSPIGSAQHNATLKNDVSLHADSYLQDKADAKPVQRAAESSSHQRPSAAVASIDGSASVPIVMSIASAQEKDEEAESAFVLRLRKALPIIVVVLLLLGLLGALLSSVFFPSNGPGADIVPLHSVAGTMVSSIREIAIWSR
jgi:hypothetical protein